MDYLKPYSAETQAEFYKAEAETLQFGTLFSSRPYAKYMKRTLLAIDAIFAVRLAHDSILPPVPLIVAHDIADWRYEGNVMRCLRATQLYFELPEEQWDVVAEALHYMQALEWTSQTAISGEPVTPDTLLRLHTILCNGKAPGVPSSAFRETYLPHKKGTKPSNIPEKVDELCQFINGDYFSPLGQASAIHHAFERIVPFDSLIDRTGLLTAFMPMFRRGLFVDGCLAPISWGCALEKEYRRKLKDASRKDPSDEKYTLYRERWGVYNARNTYLAVYIANRFLSQVDKLNAAWRSQGFKIPANSAIDKLLDLFLAIPRLSSKHAANCIGKSYGATNEAMHQLMKVGILEEIAIDNRERIYVCKQAEQLITNFVDDLIKLGKSVKEPAID